MTFGEAHPVKKSATTSPPPAVSQKPACSAVSMNPISSELLGYLAAFCEIAHPGENSTGIHNTALIHQQVMLQKFEAR